MPELFRNIFRIGGILCVQVCANAYGTISLYYSSQKNLVQNDQQPEKRNAHQYPCRYPHGLVPPPADAILVAVEALRGIGSINKAFHGCPRFHLPQADDCGAQRYNLFLTHQLKAASPVHDTYAQFTQVRSSVVPMVFRTGSGSASCPGPGYIGTPRFSSDILAVP
jgi:hypothetical protein